MREFWRTNKMQGQLTIDDIIVCRQTEREREREREREGERERE